MAWSDEARGHAAGGVVREFEARRWEMSSGGGSAAGVGVRGVDERVCPAMVGAAVIGCALVRDAPPAVSVAVAVMRAV